MHNPVETPRANTASLSSVMIDGPRLLAVFWLVSAGIALSISFSLFQGTDSFAGPALLIAASALFPVYLWCARRVPGLPVFPLFASAFLMTHVFPLLHPTPRILGYSHMAIWSAALTVAGFLWLTTAVWWTCATRPRRLPSTCLSVGGDRGHALYLAILLAATALSIAASGGWLSQLSEGTFTTLRGFIRGLTGVAILMLALAWGERRLSPATVKLFVTIFLLLCVSNGASLFLVDAIVGCLMLTVGWMLGRGRLPAFTLLAVGVFAFLHLGKGPMRERYWAAGNQGHIIQAIEYPSLYAEWFETALEELRASAEGDDRTESILARPNNINILLQVQEMTPEVVPYLGGETYAIIPSSVLPRLLFPEKASPHMGSAILNVHYGNQTWEGAQSTTIGWGLLNESVGNFGHAGWIALALCLGVFFGVVTRIGVGLPSASIQSLVAVFTMGFAVQTEWIASVFLSAYVQGLSSFLAVALPFARRVAVDPPTIEGDQPSIGWHDLDGVIDPGRPS